MNRPASYAGGAASAPYGNCRCLNIGPVGADVPQPPDGAGAIEAGNPTYYFAGGAFYAEQNGGYVIAPPPIGVTVPELPPGAVEAPVNGAAAYQFNGIYYRRAFVNGVTQSVTFMP